MISAVVLLLVGFLAGVATCWALDVVSGRSGRRHPSRGGFDRAVQSTALSGRPDFRSPTNVKKLP